MPIAEKRAFAHFEVDSSGALEDTDRAADAAFEQLQRRAAAAGPDRLGPPVSRLVGGLVHGPRVGPRGLAPEALLREAAQAGGLELEALAARLEPPAGVPWYRAADEAPPGAPAAALGASLVAWALASRPPDSDWLVAAAASLARLTHFEAAERADACLFALLLQDVALLGGRSSGPRGARACARAAGGALGRGDALGPAGGRRARPRFRPATTRWRRAQASPARAIGGPGGIAGRHREGRRGRGRAGVGRDALRIARPRRARLGWPR